MSLHGHTQTLLTIGYLAAALLCGAAAYREWRLLRRARYPLVWLALAAALALMGAQVSTRLPGMLTQWGRMEAAAGGWYWNRGLLQERVMLFGPVVVALLALGLAWLLRGAWRRTLPAVLALAYVVSFGLIQSVSSHYVDRLLHQRLVLPLKTWGDLAGIGLALAAVGWTLLAGGGIKGRRAGLY